MTMSSPSSQIKVNTPLIVLGCLAVTLCLAVVLIILAAVSGYQLFRGPLATQFAFQPTETSFVEQEPTLSTVFQPTRAPESGPTQALVELQPVEIPAWSLALLDDFSWNRCAWYTGPAENDWWQGSWEIKDGKYRIDLTGIQGFITWEYIPAAYLADFDIAAEIMKPGATSASEAGLVFRGNENNYYVYLVSIEYQDWFFGLYYDDAWQTITDWTLSEAIQTDQPNRLRVVAAGSHFQFFINGTLVGEAEDDHLITGQVGVTVQAEENVSSIFEFDNLELHAPLGEMTGTPESQPELEMSAAEAAGLLGKIIFASARDGNYEIYAVNPDGNALARLTDSPGNDYAPTWSPDGKQIVFVSDRDGNPELYHMNADGSTLVRLTSDPAEDASPAWSPDGSQIAFVSWRDGYAELYLIDANGDHLKRLTESQANDFAPTWSPDGTKLAFLSDRETDLNIYTLDLVVGQELMFTYDNLIGSEGLSWSPDGQQILYVSRKDGNAELYARQVETKEVTRLTNNPSADLYPIWSSDGKYITFVSLRDGNYEINIMNVADHSILRVTDNPTTDTTPSWGK
jgi:hypothetical protein